MFLGVIRLEVYPLFIAGWASNNKYRTFGAIRGIVQTLSFEINFTLMLFILILSRISAELLGLLKINYYVRYAVFFFPFFVIFIILLIIDSNRTPFDFSEGESELVSGFNTEYRSGVFALIFLAEYAKILLFRILVVGFLIMRRASSIGAYLGIVVFRAF